MGVIVGYHAAGPSPNFALFPTSKHNPMAEFLLKLVRLISPGQLHYPREDDGYDGLQFVKGRFVFRPVRLILETKNSFLPESDGLSLLLLPVIDASPLCLPRLVGLVQV